VIGQDIVLSQYLKREFVKDKKNFLYWRIFVALFYPLADLVIFPSKLIGKDLADNFRVAKEKLELIHNWVRKQSFRKTNHHPKYDLIYVGRLSAQKRPLLLLDIFREVLIKLNGRAKMCIVGYGEYSKRMNIYSRKIGISGKVFFAGSAENVFSYLTDAKVFLLASEYEGEPISVLEAMSSGLPVVSMKYEGLDQLITNGKDGYICTSKEEAVDNIIKLLCNSRLRVQMGKNGARKILNNYSDKNLDHFIGRMFS
jgi:glycosyltransferase involved in cell wall biosynthesis